MTLDLQALGEEYSSALSQFLKDGGEDSLGRAYALGSAALRGELGLLAVLSLQEQAFHAVQRGPAALHATDAAKVLAFLAESLSPFEMALRGYAEANRELQILNGKLAQQNVELRRAQADIEVSNRELEAFSYSVSHDLRSPLRSIDHFIHLLLKDETRNLSPAGCQHLDGVCRAARRMSGLIDDLLHLAKVSRAGIARTAVDLSALAREIAADLQQRHPEHRIAVHIRDDLHVDADPQLLRVLLENLLGNAWKFTAKTPDPQLSIGAEERQGQRTYFVRDNGAGFDMAHAERLFRPFQRLHSEAEFPGTGIGLATVARIVERHGGSLSAEGRVNEGATIYFTLPASP